MDELKDTMPENHVPDEAERQLLVRLGIAEREVRAMNARSRILGWGLVLTLLVALLPFFAPGLPEALGFGDTGTVEATEMILVDANGNTRGTWSVDEAGNAVLAFMDTQQRPRMTLTVRAAGFPGLSLSNSAGERLATMGALNDGSANLVFADGSGTPRVVLGMSEGNTGGFVVADASGGIQIGFDVDAQGVSGVIMPEFEDGGN